MKQEGELKAFEGDTPLVAMAASPDAMMIALINGGDEDAIRMVESKTVAQRFAKEFGPPTKTRDRRIAQILARYAVKNGTPVLKTGITRVDRYTAEVYRKATKQGEIVTKSTNGKNSARDIYVRKVAQEIGADVNVTETRSAEDHGSAGRVVVSAWCHAGSHFRDETFTDRYPPEIIKKKMIQRGWAMARKPCCPDHIKTKQETKMPTLTAKKPEQPKVDASIAARVAKREAFQWIEESFEMLTETTGRYKAGVSDETIAKETGLSVEAVAQIRQEMFGAIGEDPEITELRETLESLKTRFEALENEQSVVAAEILKAMDRLEKLARRA